MLDSGPSGAGSVDGTILAQYRTAFTEQILGSDQVFALFWEMLLH